jgi:hypothetical protein
LSSFVFLCSEALQDAQELAVHVSVIRQSPQQQPQQQQQEVQQTQTKRLLGVPTVEFGALLDLPDAWWAVFPHKRRRQQQHQQQQHYDHEHQQQ